jgi:hypothetical protein
MKTYILIIIFLVSLIKTTQCQDRVITRIESVQSLYIETYKNNIKLSSATGFVIKSKTQNYLITNWHVATNKDPKTKKWINPKVPISPDNVKILHNSDTLGSYSIKTEKLLDNTGNKIFKEFQINNEMVDMVAIPLVDTLINVNLYPVNYNLGYDSLIITPTDRVFVLGFPLGVRAAPAMPIWKSGLIASEPDIDQEGKPIIWIDILGYGGMSGSPVYYITDKLKYRNGSTSNLIGGSQTFFMGIFSHGRHDISTGALWKSTYLKSLFDSLP